MILSNLLLGVVPENIKKEETVQEIEGLLSQDTITKITQTLVDFAFKLAIAIVVFLIGRFIIRSLYKWVNRILNRRDTDRSLATFVLSLVKITLYFILIITVVGILGIETSSFLALFASAGVAVGLALSGTLQNFAGGVLILLLKPYKVGDFIEVQGFSGTVKEIQIFHTIINTPDNKAIIIPNGGLSTGSVNNYSLEDFRRIEWTISVAYGTDFNFARTLLLDILNSDERIIPNKGTSVSLAELADSSINIVVRAWVKSPDFWGVFYDINERVYSDLPQKGIEFPYPQLDVHIDKN